MSQWQRSHMHKKDVAKNLKQEKKIPKRYIIKKTLTWSGIKPSTLRLQPVQHTDH